MTTCAAVLLLAFLLDYLVGDPEYRVHPARLIGRVISVVERAIVKAGYNRLGGGVLLATLVCVSVIGSYLILRGLTFAVHPFAAMVFDVFTVYSCIALGDLIMHAAAVAEPLAQTDLPAARRAVQRIVGRETESLDAAGIARATIESVAESFVDGVFAPFFWCVTGALCAHLVDLSILPCAVGAMLCHKTVNTLDSMVGYKNEKYMLFGRFSARFDDVLNYLPARVAVVPLTVAAAAYRLDTRAALKILVRDRLKHASPNAGHAESLVAGALRLRLGGPLQYPHGLVEKAWLGDGSPDAGTPDVTAAARLIGLAGWLSAIMSSIILYLADAT